MRCSFLLSTPALGDIPKCGEHPYGVTRVIPDQGVVHGAREGRSVPPNVPYLAEKFSGLSRLLVGSVHGWQLLGSVKDGERFSHQSCCS